MPLYCIFGSLLPHIHRNGSANCAAADIQEPSAALVSFQRYQPGQPPCKNVNSADCSLTSASHFGGFYANYAVCVISSNQKRRPSERRFISKLSVVNIQNKKLEGEIILWFSLGNFILNVNLCLCG